MAVIKVYIVEYKEADTGDIIETSYDTEEEALEACDRLYIFKGDRLDYSYGIFIKIGVIKS
jgi:hypothetical protein